MTTLRSIREARSRNVNHAGTLPLTSPTLQVGHSGAPHHGRVAHRQRLPGRDDAVGQLRPGCCPARRPACFASALHRSLIRGAQPAQTRHEHTERSSSF